MPLPLRPLLLAVLLALAVPAAATAAADSEVGIEDERLVLSEPNRTAATVAAWKAIGVDTVRIHAQWFRVSPGVTSKRRPPGFDPANHRSRGYDWAILDQGIGLVRGAGMRVMLTVTGPPPLWASGDPRKRNERFKPDPKGYGRFARAVATRYGALVDRYLLWNEPNQAGWLQPQNTCRGKGKRRRCEHTAPHVYRDLVRAAGPQIERADPGAQVLIGELAPIGSKPTGEGSPIKPLAFLRAMGCVDARHLPLRDGECRGFRPARGDAFGYHPHGVSNSPDRSNPDRDSAQIADLPRLQRTLDRLTRRGRIGSPGRRPFDLYLTEFSYQTSPPDKVVGISLSKQAVYQQQAAYIAWRNPRVRNLTQYQWEDEGVRNLGSGSRRYAGWQGGLRFLDGRPKPALAAFTSPFVADVSEDGSSALLWGQIRPGGAYDVTLQRAPLEGGSFAPVEVIRSSPSGIFARRVELEGPDRWTATWTDPLAGVRRTAVVPVDPGEGPRVLAAVP
ncbi:MAG: GH39 [uncultured Solirubrobacteraceae bacterium]|uniref:GH39 n=1 Tax=uncultured Solirubrobacteraceae bacterium TaxID=1162706 RepID=A0A6J4TF19_9ACTN|nr:MAG: GH39 [uncultured Solirubrobacteraceae bacterium]